MPLPGSTQDDRDLGNPPFALAFSAPDPTTTGLIAATVSAASRYAPAAWHGVRAAVIAATAPGWALPALAVAVGTGVVLLARASITDPSQPPAPGVLPQPDSNDRAEQRDAPAANSNDSDDKKPGNSKGTDEAKESAAQSDAAAPEDDKPAKRERGQSSGPIDSLRIAHIAQLTCAEMGFSTEAEALDYLKGLGVEAGALGDEFGEPENFHQLLSQLRALQQQLDAQFGEGVESLGDLARALGVNPLTMSTNELASALDASRTRFAALQAACQQLGYRSITEPGAATRLSGT